MGVVKKRKELVKVAKINQEEYEVLKGLEDQWKWIARNNMYGSKFEAHTSRPYKMVDSHWSNGDMTLELLEGEYLFQFIQWEDEEPHNIAELVKEYEFGKILLAMAEEETVWELEYEREETEVKKDIEWLKEEVLGLRSNGNGETNQTAVEREIGRLQGWAWNNCVDRVY